LLFFLEDLCKFCRSDATSAQFLLIIAAEKYLVGLVLNHLKSYSALSMSLSILLVLSILFAAVVLFISGKFRPDLIALLVVVALLLCRILSIADALSGFSNPAVIAIAAIFVVTAGLTNTGIAALFGSYLFRAAGKSETKLIALTMGASAVLSLVMNNIAAAAVLLPGLNSVARRSNISPSKLMMPLSF
jgi:di/tricarboxylate transporter